MKRSFLQYLLIIFAGWSMLTKVEGASCPASEGGNECTELNVKTTGPLDIGFINCEGSYIKREVLSPPSDNPPLCVKSGELINVIESKDNLRQFTISGTRVQLVCPDFANLNACRLQ